MSKESERVAAKFVKGIAGSSPRTRIGTYNTPDDYGSRVINDGKRVYSYGSHFLIAERDDVRGGYWVNEGKYQTGEWKSGKPKYSPTTAGHVRDVRDAVLKIAVPTDEMRDGWQDMPRHTERYPMRFYRDRTANDAPRYEVLEDTDNMYGGGFRLYDTVCCYNVGYSRTREGIQERLAELGT